MATAKGIAPAVFDLKSASLSLAALLLQTTNKAALASELSRRFDSSPDFFNNDPVVIDLAAVSGERNAINFYELAVLLRRYKMQPVGVRSGNAAQMQAAVAAGLAELPDELDRNAEDSQSETGGRAVTPGAATVVIHKPLRSGQQVYARGGDLVVMAAVNCGAEVIADGHIHVYAPLRGKAIAGAKGNTEARIFSTCLQPELVSIAGIYRTTEHPLPADVVGKPAQVRLEDDRLVFEGLL